MKPLSERLQWMFDNNYMDWDVVSDAIQLAKSVESAQVGAVELDLGCILRVRAESGQWIPPIDGQRVALVPLPQQSET